MYRMYDFTCSHCGHTHERYADENSHTDPCPQCDRDADRIISPVRCKLDGTDPGFPDAYDKWARDHEKQARIERKRAAERGED
jgi:putative FmdB family regulatory protein